MYLNQSWNQKKTFFTIGILAVVGLLLAITLICGVQVHQDNSGIRISGGIFYSVKVPYSEIKDVQLKTLIDYGSRTNGASIALYKLGNYHNSEYGSYKLFVNTDIHKYIVIQYGNQGTVVFNNKNEESTNKTYESLLELIK